MSDANVNHAPRSRGAAAEEYNHVLISGYHDGGEGEGGGDERDGARIVLRVGKCEGEENQAGRSDAKMTRTGYGFSEKGQKRGLVLTTRHASKG